MEKFLNFDDFIALNEANANYPILDFEADLKSLGWVYEKDHNKGKQFAKYVTRKDGTKERLKVVCHPHESKKVMMPATLRDMRTILKNEYILTGDRSSIDSAPWDKWEVAKPIIEDDYETKDEEVVDEKEMSSISWANTRYNKVELIPLVNYIYNAKDICIMKKKENGKIKYNTCRNIGDKRPLNKMWFDELYPGKSEYVPSGFAFANYLKDTLKNRKKEKIVKVFPVSSDGIVVGEPFEESVNITFKNNINE